MKNHIVIKFISFLILSLFLAGTTQIGFSNPITNIENVNIELIPQTAEKRMSFDPFMEGWGYRKQITIDHTKVASDLIDFPVFIAITDSNLQTSAQSDGDDILFMNTVGFAQQLNHEIEDYDGTTGELFAWVNIPSLSSSVNTIFYMYYGNPTCDNQQHVEDTWNSNFMAVWHLQQNPTQPIRDSTIHQNDGTSFGSMTSSNVVDGKTGKCFEFDGVNDYVSVPDTSSLEPSKLTLSAWFRNKQENFHDGHFLAKQCYDIWGNSAGQTYGFDTTPDTLLVCGSFEKDTYEQVEFIGNYEIEIDVWYSLVLTFDEVIQMGLLYVNGNLEGSKSCDPSVLWYNYPWDFSMGASRYGTGSSNVINHFFKCFLDEIRVMNTPLSAEWILTEYNNQNSPSTFFIIGLEEAIPFVRTIMFGQITNLNAGVTSIIFNAVKLRCIRFFPFSFNTYTSNERICISPQYLGFLTQTRILAINQAYP